MTQKRTLALEISAELFVRIKKHVERSPNPTQKAFITDIINQALDKLEKQEIRI